MNPWNKTWASGGDFSLPFNPWPVGLISIDHHGRTYLESDATKLSELTMYTVSTPKNMSGRQRISFYFGRNFGAGPEAEQIGNLN